MRSHRNLIILLVMAALVAAALYYVIPPSERTHLGLDLQGGLEVVYTARTADGSPPTREQMDQAVAILDKRVNGLGVTESQIQTQGSDQIAIALPGITDTEQALSVIGKTAQLEFFLDDSRSRPVGPLESKDAALKELRDQGVSKAVVEQLREEGTTKDFSLVMREAEPENDVPEEWFVYRRPPAMTGDAIDGANASFDQANRPIVEMDFTDEGSKTFQQITRDLYRTGLLKGQPQTFAIVLDNVMASDPYIDYTDPTLRDGISGSAQISGGNMTVQESKDLVLVLRTGALPVKLEVAYQQQVSATLGKDSLDEALVAGLIGLGLVLVYMVVFYRFLGLVADLALIVYGVLLWGLFNVIPVTLTLPGIAGLILTIGVAADANVVIFERIKEEVAVGKTVRSAVNSGYALGFKTILDANILTVLTAVVLFIFATAQPRGFAVTLILGVIVSMFTAVLFTRAVLGMLAGFSFFNRPSLMGAITFQPEAEARAAAEGASRTAASRSRRGAAAPVAEPAAEGVPSGGADAKPAAPRPRRKTSSKRKKRR